MSKINGCELPDDLYYLIEKHVWARPMEDGSIRVGMTSVAAKLSGGKLSAVTPKKKKIGKEILRGKSLATVESSKFVGPVPSPVSGTLLRTNENLDSDPNLAISDPYGEGWMADMQPSDWDGEKTSLAFGDEGLADYRAELEANNISCD